MAITSASLTSRPALDQVGPVMVGSQIWKVATLRDDFEGAARFIGIPEERSIRIEHRLYGSSMSHIATVFMNQGRIVCDYCSYARYVVVWCKHIQLAARSHEDYPLFAIEQEEKILVPMVPTDGVFVSVILRRSEDRADFVNVVMVLDSVKDGEPYETVIGVLFRRFGMIELRSLIADFMEGWLKNPEYFFPPEGSISTHGSGNVPVPMERVNAREAQLSPFSRAFYMATIGQPLGLWEGGRVGEDDAPEF